MITFFRESIEELKKLQVPSRKETYLTTAIIFAAIVVTSLAILFADFLILKIVGFIFGL